LVIPFRLRTFEKILSVKKILFCISLFFAAISMRAQVNQTPEPTQLIQLSGLVLTDMSGQLVPVPYATIYLPLKNRGTFTDRRGFFNLVVEKKDLVRFSSIGFDPADFLVPDSLKSDHYSVVQMMGQDTFMLPQITIFPWPSRDHFKTEFLAMDVTPELQERAARNLANESLAALRKAPDAVAFSGREGANYYLRQQTKAYYYIGQTPPMNIFSPLAWAKFFKAWQDGDFKKKK
jgi:hypothetical protein